MVKSLQLPTTLTKKLVSSSVVHLQLKVDRIYYGFVWDFIFALGWEEHKQ